MAKCVTFVSDAVTESESVTGKALFANFRDIRRMTVNMPVFPASILLLDAQR